MMLHGGIQQASKRIATMQQRMPTAPQQQPLPGSPVDQAARPLILALHCQYSPLQPAQKQYHMPLLHDSLTNECEYMSCALVCCSHCRNRQYSRVRAHLKEGVKEDECAIGSASAHIGAPVELLRLILQCLQQPLLQGTLRMRANHHQAGPPACDLDGSFFKHGASAFPTCMQWNF